MSTLPTPQVPCYTQAQRDYRVQLIRAAAYLRFRVRQGAVESETSDWLAAEAQVDAMLTFHPTYGAECDRA
jgi:hypothetical protein